MNSPDDNSSSRELTGWFLTLRTYSYLIWFFLVNPILLATFPLDQLKFGQSLYPLYIGFIFAQASLIGIWCCFSERHWWIRWPVSIVLWLALIWCFPLCRGFSSLDDEVLLGPYILVVLFVASVLRAFLGTLQNFRTSTNTPRIGQVSIKQVLGWTTLAGVSLAFLKARWPQHVATSSSTVDYVYMGTMAGVVAIVCGCVLFSRRPLITALIAAVFAPIAGALSAPIAGAISLYLVHRDWAFSCTSDFIWHFGMISVSQSLMMLITIWLATWGGIRRRL